MVNNNLSTLIEDDHQIASLLIRWGYARDSDDWETLAGCFHDDATIHISWISGLAKDFVIGQKRLHMPGYETVAMFNRQFPVFVQPYLGA